MKLNRSEVNAMLLSGKMLAFFVFISIFISACASAPTKTEEDQNRTFSLSGKVSVNGKGVGGAEVLLYDPLFHLPPMIPPYASAISDENGDFTFEAAPEGVYVVVAKKDDLFSFYGRNPVRLVSDVKGLALPLLKSYEIKKTEIKEGEEEGISGRVFWDGKPVMGAQVFAYLHTSRGLRGPGYAASELTGMDGSYSLDLPPGTYFVAARQRERYVMGSLKPGDLFGVLPVFPLVVAEGERVSADFETVEVPTREKMSRIRGSFAKLSGRILDENGRPIQNMRAALYANAQLFNRPLAASEPSDEQGRYYLETPLSGEFTLGARQFLGGPPQPGELIGLYRGDDGSIITLKLNKHLSDVDIIVQNTP